MTRRPLGRPSRGQEVSRWRWSGPRSRRRCPRCVGSIGDLKKLAREAASAPALDNLVANLDALDAHAGAEVARRRADPRRRRSTPEDAGELATWIGPGFQPSKLQIAPGEQPIVDVPGPPLELRVQVRHLTSRLAQKAGAARAPIAVLVAHASAGA